VRVCMCAGDNADHLDALWHTGRTNSTFLSVLDCFIHC